MPEIFDLAHFDSYREDNRLEVKAANGGLPGTLWDTYSSFANSYGGCIICGVVERKDGSWKTTGLRDLPKLKKSFWDTVHNNPNFFRFIGSLYTEIRPNNLQKPLF